MSEEEILEILRSRLSIQVITESNYSGGLDGGDLYRDDKTVLLLLDEEVISECGI